MKRVGAVEKRAGLVTTGASAGLRIWSRHDSSAAVRHCPCPAPDARALRAARRDWVSPQILDVLHMLRIAFQLPEQLVVVVVSIVAEQSIAAEFAFAP